MPLVRINLERSKGTGYAAMPSLRVRGTTAFKSSSHALRREGIVR